MLLNVATDIKKNVFEVPELRKSYLYIFKRAFIHYSNMLTLCLQIDL